VDGRLLIARRPASDRLAGLWELPGGKIEAGETPQQCLRRELLEELGVDSHVDEVVARTVYEYDHGRFELIALTTRLLGEPEMLFHDRLAWVTRAEMAGYDLAPADTCLMTELGGQFGPQA
jgi:8-oxo-dGTP diphosphatase